MPGRWIRRPARVVSASLLALALPLLLASGARAASAPGQAYVVQALAGTTAQVLVDGRVVQGAAAPGTVVGPLGLAAGQHVVTVRSGGSDLVSARFGVTAGGSLDVVAHRASDTAMTPVVTVFPNDPSPVAPGKTRLVVSHVAVAEPADIRVDGTPLFRNVADGESLSLVVPAKAYTVDVVATAGPRTILPPVRVALRPGTLSRVFAYGDPDRRTVDTIVQVLPVPVVGAGAPRSVHTGDGGQAATEFVGSRPVPWPAIVAGTLALGVVGAVGAVRRAGSGGGRSPR